MISVLFALLPLITNDKFVLNIMIPVFIFALFGACWDLSYGVAGILNLGPGIAFGVGGFLLAILAASHYSPLFALLLSAGGSALTGIIIWIPSIRMSGAYLAIVTLVILLLFGDIAVIRTGEEGLSIGINYFSAPLLQSYYLALAISIFGIFALYGLSRTQFGLRARAMKDDEIAAKSISINTLIHKLIILVVSSFFLGLAGAFYALYLSSVNYAVFSINTNFLGVVISIIGGSGSIVGALIGALVVELPSQYLVSYGSYSVIFYGAIMIVVIMFLGNGLMQGLELVSSKFKLGKKE